MSENSVVVWVPGLQALLDVLRADGWTVMGPTVRDAAIVHGEITSVQQLPAGVGDDQDAAYYRLRRRDDEALFGFASVPQAWKAQLFPSRELLWRAQRDGDGLDFDAGPEPAPRLALLGVRACDLHAIAVHDRVLRERAYADPRYAARRDAVFVVAVTCGAPGGTCFCASMGTGPAPDSGFDLALTELLDGGHRFLLDAGSERGADVLARLPDDLVAEVTGDDTAAAETVVETSRASMGRRLDTAGLRDLLYDNAEHPRWDDVASRCLACSNCTMVCPTCFCTSVEDVGDLAGESLERWRVWDSCFTSDFSYLHGGSVRASTRSRYRQWATHKLAAWIDQFGTSGCVGCGRCITWCPAAIDLTAEVAAIRAEPLTAEE